MLKKCLNCNTYMQYLDNESNNYCYLICPKCHSIDSSQKYVTTQERIDEGYLRYERKEEKFAMYLKENFIDNDDV